MTDVRKPAEPDGGPPGTVKRGQTTEQPQSAAEVQPAHPEREFTVQSRTQFQLVLRRFLQHRAAVISIIVLVLVVVLALVGGRLWHYRFDEVTADFSTGPSLKHPFGTDSIGHDYFAQVLRGAQKSVQISLLVALLSTSFGTVLGAVAGYYGGKLDGLLMRFTDVVLSIPYIALLIVLSNIVRQGSGNWFFIALVLAAVAWTYVARTVRAVFLSLREKEFVEAARALGATDRRIIFRHMLPNAMGPIIVAATIAVAIAILAETSLSYIGLGVRPPDTSLGLLIASGQQAATTRPWLFYFPGLFIIVIALTVNFVGDGLRDAFDPTQTRVRA